MVLLVNEHWMANFLGEKGLNTSLFVCYSFVWVGLSLVAMVDLLYPPTHTLLKDSHNTWNFIWPFSSWIVCRFFNVHRELMNMEDICETGPTVHSPYLRRLESLTISRCHCKGGTLSSVILRPWVLVGLESDLWSATWQPDAQTTEPPVHSN